MSLERFNPDRLDNYPLLPGVYRMLDAEGRVLYVGKAKSLRKRLRQYFSASSSDFRPQIPFLLEKVADIETVVVDSEKEALLLENTLIKQHQPPYNALLKDDKGFIALAISQKHPFPRLEIIRSKARPSQNTLYFGPYTSAFAARKTVDLLGRLFPLRQCSDEEFKRRTRPCILYDIKKCLAPCVQKCSKDEYGELVRRTIQFLRGQDRTIVDELTKEMEKAVELLEFERAADLLKTIRQIEQTLESQKVDLPSSENVDVLSLYREGDEGVISKLAVRYGKLVQVSHFEFSHALEDDADVLARFIVSRYVSRQESVSELLLPLEIEGRSAIEEILAKQCEKTIRLTMPLRGRKKALVEMAEQNALHHFKSRQDVDLAHEKVLLELQEAMHLTRYPERIECFDNSHLAGSDAVSALVAFTDGKKDTSKYRKYLRKQANEADDYGAMREILTRRLKRGKEENDLPDLLILDGGKGQLHVAEQVMEELNIITCDLISLAKEGGRHDKGLADEQIFLPHISEPLLLPRRSPLLFFIQRIRDEAHRFVLTFHRKKRSKRFLESPLDAIPGIGPVKRRLLIRHFGSLKRLLESEDKLLDQLQGLSAANIAALKKFKVENSKRRD